MEHRREGSKGGLLGFLASALRKNGLRKGKHSPSGHRRTASEGLGSPSGAAVSKGDAATVSPVTAVVATSPLSGRSVAPVPTTVVSSRMGAKPSAPAVSTEVNGGVVVVVVDPPMPAFSGSNLAVVVPDNVVSDVASAVATSSPHSGGSTKGTEEARGRLSPPTAFPGKVESPVAAVSRMAGGWQADSGTAAAAAAPAAAGLSISVAGALDCVPASPEAAASPTSHEGSEVALVGHLDRGQSAPAWLMDGAGGELGAVSDAPSVRTERVTNSESAVLPRGGARLNDEEGEYGDEEGSEVGDTEEKKTPSFPLLPRLSGEFHRQMSIHDAATDSYYEDGPTRTEKEMFLSEPVSDNLSGEGNRDGDGANPPNGLVSPSAAAPHDGNGHVSDPEEYLRHRNSEGSADAEVAAAAEQDVGEDMSSITPSMDVNSLLATVAPARARSEGGGLEDVYQAAVVGGPSAGGGPVSASASPSRWDGSQDGGGAGGAASDPGFGPAPFSLTDSHESKLASTLHHAGGKAASLQHKSGSRGKKSPWWYSFVGNKRARGGAGGEKPAGILEESEGEMSSVDALGLTGSAGVGTSQGGAPFAQAAKSGSMGLDTGYDTEQESLGAARTMPVERKSGLSPTSPGQESPRTEIPKVTLDATSSAPAQTETDAAEGGDGGRGGAGGAEGALVGGGGGGPTLAEALARQAHASVGHVSRGWVEEWVSRLEPELEAPLSPVAGAGGSPGGGGEGKTRTAPTCSGGGRCL